jgi:hypothetical protein
VRIVPPSSSAGIVPSGLTAKYALVWARGGNGSGDLGVRPDEPDFGRYLNGLHFGEATLTFPQTLVLR